MYAFAIRDPNDARLLAHNVFVQGGPYNNSVENCLDTCTSQGYIAAGMELAQECCTCFTSSPRASLI